jgi:hypothetical protein
MNTIGGGETRLKTVGNRIRRIEHDLDKVLPGSERAERLHERLREQRELRELILNDLAGRPAKVSATVIANPFEKATAVAG